MTDPKTFGRFEVERVLGRGAMGIVYLARDSFLERKVAIKTIKAHAELDDTEVAELRDRFVAEARSASALTHPNLVTVYDVGQEGDSFYIAMEYVRGESLDKVLRSERVFSFKEAADLAVQICSALDYAHAKDIVHRDIKPANIMLTRGGRPKIADFGVARRATSTLTRTGTLVGTPAYMSPEQITGHLVSGASDQFSFGVVLFQMLTGEQPFEGENPTTVMYRIVHDEPRLPRSFNDQLPEAIDRALARALAKAPADRYPTCGQFAEEVREALGASKAGAAELLGTSFEPKVRASKSPGDAGGDAVTLSMQFAPSSGGADVDDDAAAGVVGEEPAVQPTVTLHRSIVAALREHWRPESLRWRSPIVIGACSLGALVLVSLFWWSLAGGAASPSDGVGGAPGGAIGSVAAEQPAEQTAAPLDPAAARDIGVVGGRQELQPSSRQGGAGLAESATAAPGASAPSAAGAGGAPASVELTVRSNVDPARVRVDGRLLAQETPLTLTFAPAADYVVVVEKEGFEPVSTRLSLDGLSPAQRAAGELYFPLQQMTTDTPADPRPADSRPAGPRPAAVAPGSPPLAEVEDLAPIQLPTNGEPPEPDETTVPRFPEWAAAAGLREYVVVEIVIDAEGRVRDAAVIGQGVHPDLDALALAAVRTWTFRPARVDGEPVAVRHNLAVRFERQRPARAGAGR